MAVEVKTSDTQQLESFLRRKLDDLQARYKSERTREVKEAFLRTLKLFTSLVLHQKRLSAADLEWVNNA